MSTNDTNPQERIAREHFHDAHFLGIDGDGAAHYWSRYHQAVIVLDGETVTFKTPLADTPLSSLAEWVEHVRAQRGPWESLRLSPGLADHLTQSLHP